MNDKKDYNNYPEQCNKALLNVTDVMSLLDIKKDRAYFIMRKCNSKLEKMGKLTLKGRVNKRFLLEELGISEE
jgi:hypothetical protein